MDMMGFIVEEALVIIPVIYVIGLFIKSTSINDRYIPCLLWAIGVILSVVIVGGIQGFIQGTLCAAIAVFFNQLYKQLNK